MKATNLDHGFGICEHTELDCDCAREAGNVWYADPEDEPLTIIESSVIYASIAILAFALVAIIAIIAMAFGYASGWIF